MKEDKNPKDYETELDLAGIQEQELEILLRFDEFCKDSRLTYTLIGGTLLGAVRHRGFIPWDDDIDVGMPRPSYDRFLALKDVIRKRMNLRLEGFEGVPVEDSPYCKLMNPAIVVKAEKEVRTTNLWIDVIPIDALPSDDLMLRSLYKRAGAYQRVLMFLSSTVASSSGVLRGVLKAFAYPLRAGGLILRMTAKRLDSLGRQLSYASTPYIGVLTWGMYGPGERFSLKGLTQTSTCTFEGHVFPCMSCWDEYLTGIFGDYMELPSEDKRVNHGLRAWYSAEKKR